MELQIQLAHSISEKELLELAAKLEEANDIKKLLGWFMDMYKLETSIQYVQQLPGNMKQMQIESVVTPSGNSGHVVVPKAWIGKEAIVKLKEKEIRGTKK